MGPISAPSDTSKAKFALQVTDKLINLHDDVAAATFPDQELLPQFPRLLWSGLVQFQLRLSWESTPPNIDSILFFLQTLCDREGKRADPSEKQLDKKYPGIALLLRGSTSHAKKNLQELYSPTKIGDDDKKLKEKRKQILKRVNILTAEVANTERKGLVAPLPPKTEQLDFSAQANTLHSVLSKYKTCKTGDTVAEIIPKISLSGYRQHDESGSVFDVLFPDHPHQDENGKACNWHNAAVQIPTEVNFKGKKDQPDAAKGIEYHEFCGTITQSHEEQLFLTLSRKEAKLFMPEFANSGISWMLTAPGTRSMTLRSLLEEGYLGAHTLPVLKMKIVLMYLLGKGVWQFYDSGLMVDEWTKDNVEFMFEQRLEEGEWTIGVFLNQPLISAPSCPSPPHENGPRKMTHTIFPKIRQLGIMLLEVVIGREIDNYKGADPSYRGKSGGLKDLLEAKEKYEQWSVKNDWPNAELVVKAIGNSLDDHQYLPKSRDKSNPDFSVRNVLYEKVVRHLEGALTVNYAVSDPNHLSLAPLFKHREFSTSPRGLARKMAQPNTWSHSNSQRHQHTPSPMESPVSIPSPFDQTHSDNWFSELDKLSEILRARPDERDAKYDQQRVKIAVIDTGVSEEKAGVAYKDFIDGDDGRIQQGSGHGTDIVELIDSCIEESSLYVARVFDGDGLINDRTPDLVAEAIQWARKMEVDIIVLALGFLRAHDGIRKAISDAVHRDILIFSAAGNDGSIRKVAFPARLPDVMCIFSTTPGNKPSREINPPARDMDANFAILGEIVKTPENGSPPRRLQGTSIATAIAAGFAASLLDFSRQRVYRRKRKEYGTPDLKSREAMRAVFTELSSGYKHEGYHCVLPWQLLNQIPKDGDREVRRQELSGLLNGWLQF
ncbi:peptidase S8/S53 domain-containing protein [Lasiosphaeris hirsuta]|uniref:Peptidase S8/S53 domain-containing protein n=1 Tax=Lasiosphaeris hirsuta TaxID=260670 RepID=A0AA39ZVF5_9PEZI|nr:peptidase S8/S53 domain-containing protein [Lasiosphaeris hirsuta]